MLLLQREGGRQREREVEKKERERDISANNNCKSNFGNIMRNVLTEQVDVLTDSTGFGNAIDSSSPLTAQTTGRGEEETCPQHNFL